MSVEKYQQTRILTAGRMRLFGILLDRAVLLLSTPQAGHPAVRIHIQNILVQLQNSLFLNDQAARDLHHVFAIAWDQLEFDDPETLSRVLTLLSHVRDTVLMVERRRGMAVMGSG
jgi:hypothetical protein